MRLESLKIYLCILASGSFAAAARRLHMTQPAVSMAIASIENELGQKLIVRTQGQRGAMETTTAGEIFATYAKKALDEYCAMQSELASGHPQYEQFIIAATPSPGAVLLPVLAGGFKKAFPSIQLSIKTFSGTEIFRRLRANECQIAITGMLPTEQDLIFESFFYDPLEFIAPSLLDIQSSITLKKLKKLPLITRPNSSNVMQLFLKELKKVKLGLSEMNVVMQAYGNADVLQAVALGTGIGFVTRSILASSQYNNSIKIFSVKRFQVDRYIFMVRKKAAPFPSGMHLFWDFVSGIAWRKKDFPYDSSFCVDLPWKVFSESFSKK